MPECGCQPKPVPGATVAWMKSRKMNRLVSSSRVGAAVARRSRTTRGGVMQTLFRLHTGEIAGTPGEALSFLGGVSVVALVISGLWMIAARRRARRT